MKKASNRGSAYLLAIILGGAVVTDGWSQRRPEIDDGATCTQCCTFDVVPPLAEPIAEQLIVESSNAIQSIETR